MPIYEYELIDDDCGGICEGRFAAIQNLDDDPLKHCPTCGLQCKRVISNVSIKTKADLTPEQAAKRGFTTWKRAKEGEWEKVAGPGVDAIVGTDEAKEAAKEKPIKKIDLDKT